jgi:hypothetical protein
MRYTASAIICAFSYLCAVTVSGQPPADSSAARSLNAVSNRALADMQSKYGHVSQDIDNSCRSALSAMQNKEAALQRFVAGKDSSLASRVFGGTQKIYTGLLSKLNAAAGYTGSSQPHLYVPSIDSVHTAMAFLSASGQATQAINNKLQRVSSLVQTTGQLQQRMEVAVQAETFLQQREQQLKGQLSQVAGVGKLLGVNKQVYYYQQQLSQYKEMLNDKDKLEESALAAVQQAPAFQQFWQKNSAVSVLFPQQQINGVVQPQMGLQSKADVQAAIVARMGVKPKEETGTASGQEGLASGQQGLTSGAGGQEGLAAVTSLPSGGGPGGGFDIQSQISQAKDKLSALKDRLANVGTSGGSSNMTMPDFTPNSQHGKPFLSRLEAGFTLQSGQATSLLPVTLQPAAYLGYRFSDKWTAGLGVGYILGLGQDIGHLHLSNQGVSLRSYMDIKLKGSFWLTGGFEYNYLQEFAGLQSLRKLDAWQQSALAGITKKFTLRRKEGKLQLLFDFLYNRETPQGQPLVYRFSYSL